MTNSKTMHTGLMVHKKRCKTAPGRKPKSITIELDLRYKMAELMSIADAKHSSTNQGGMRLTVSATFRLAFVAAARVDVRPAGAKARVD